jgi:hypothetical protein
MDSHWAHHRASYRCRHGYNSARTKPVSRPKILYVREDRLLALIRHDRSLRRQHPELLTMEPNAVAAYLDAHNMIIVCDHNTWMIETDTATIALTEPPNLPLTAGIPAQWSGDQSICEEKSRFVWN